MSDQQQGPGWWLASDGRWYPPDQAPAVPPPETWATPPPGPPPRSGMSGGAIVALSLVGVGGILVLLFAAVALVGTESGSSSFSSTGAPIVGSGGDDPDPPAEPADAPEGFAVIEGDGVSIAAPSQWQSIDAEALEMGSDEFQAAFPDAPQEMVEQGLSAIDQGAVLVAFDFGGAGFASNVNVIEVPGEAPLEAIEDQAAQQLGALGGEVLDSGVVELPVGDALRIEYTLSVAVPGGAPVPASGMQYYVPVDGRTFVVTVTAGDDVADLADRMIQTFRVT